MKSFRRGELLSESKSRGPFHYFNSVEEHLHCSVVRVSSAMRMHNPLSSLPLLPALPDIWMYSPLASTRCSSPSHFCKAVKSTVRAGMLSPIANVSVANRTCRACVHRVNCNSRKTYPHLQAVCPTLQASRLLNTVPEALNT